MSHAATCLAGHPHDEPDLGAVTVAERTPSMAPPTAAARFSMPQVRWALLSTVLFASGLLLRLAGAPGWLSGMVFAGCYLAGGWEPAVAGWQALRERTLDVDLLIVIFAPRSSVTASNSERPGDLRLLLGSPPSRCLTTSVVRLSALTLEMPAT